MHSVSLTCGAGPDTQDWMEPVRLSQVHTDMRLHSRTAHSPHDIRVVHLCEVTLCGLFSIAVPLEPLSPTVMSDGTAAHHASAVALSDSFFGWQYHCPKLAAV